MIEIQGSKKDNYIELNMLELSIALSLLYQDSYARDVPDFLEDLQQEKIIVKVKDND
mgnify:CR=1 FL=1